MFFSDHYLTAMQSNTTSSCQVLIFSYLPFYKTFRGLVELSLKLKPPQLFPVLCSSVEKITRANANN